MAQKPRQDAQTIRPLWVIANLLLLIAVCLLLLVIKNQLSDSHKEPLVSESASENQASEPTNRGTGNTLRITSRQTVNSRRTAEVAQISAATEAVETASEAPPVPPERILPPAPVGVLATVIASATNLATAIAGRVTLRGEPPPEAPIDMSDFPPCAKLQTNSPATRNFVVGQDGGLADVFVSIVGGLDRKDYKPPPTNHELVFVNCQIQPYVSAAMEGQRLAFKNADSETHIVQLARTNNSTLLSRKLSPKTTFTSSDPLRYPDNFLRIKCEKHPWESAYLWVVDHPFFAVTDTAGNFVIPNVPPGKYTLRAMHLAARGTNTIARGIVVHANKISQVNFTLDAPAK